MPAYDELGMKLIYKGFETIGGKKYARSTNLGALNPFTDTTSIEFSRQIEAIGTYWWNMAQFQEPLGILQSTRIQQWPYVAVVPAP